MTGDGGGGRRKEGTKEERSLGDIKTWDYKWIGSRRGRSWKIMKTWIRTGRDDAEGEVMEKYEVEMKRGVRCEGEEER